MTPLLGLLGRVPRPVLFAAAALVQVALIAAMVIDRAGILREGTEVTLQTRPVDPRDFLRGDYVRLRYEISTVRLDAAGTLNRTRNVPVFVKLAPNDDGFYAAVSAHLEPVPVAGREALIKGRIAYTSECRGNVTKPCHVAEVTYGLEQYFVPEGEARDRVRAQPGQGINRRRRHVGGSCRHQAAADRRQAGLRRADVLSGAAFSPLDFAVATRKHSPVV